MLKKITRRFTTQNQRLKKIHRQQKIKSIWSSSKELWMRSKDLSRKNQLKLWISGLAIPCAICACQNCCVKSRLSPFTYWLIRRNMCFRYWSEFNDFFHSSEFLNCTTWDENSIDFFFFLGIRRCVMSAINSKKLSERRLRKMRKQLSGSPFTFTLDFYLIWAFFVQSLKKFLLRFYLRFRSTSLSVVAGSPSVYHFSSHMGQLMRHSADTIGGPIAGCSMLWPNCPVSSDKLMRISTKVRLRWLVPDRSTLTCF